MRNSTGRTGVTLKIQMSLNTKNVKFQITSPQVEKAISERKNGRSHGPDGIILELLKYVDKSIVRILTQLCNMIFAGDTIQ